MKRLPILLFMVLFAQLFTHPLLAEKKIYTTKRVYSNPLVIDGHLDDPAWESVEWGSDFIQREPYEGKAPSQKTAFKILYDDDNLYIAVHAYDTEPDKIVRRMSRRDGFAGDWVEINIDSYFDHRTAFSFTITAAGVKGDEVISNDGDNWDTSWDPIWYAKTAIDEQGWTAEMRIPFSQLRFGNKEEQIWGIQFTRRLFSKDERSNWQFIPRDAPGWVHLFGELHGIKGIKPHRQIELLPYTVGKLQRFEKEEGNLFATGRSNSIAGGLDGKIGITSDLTLDFTMNPDFGQVEADPSEVNLTAFETFLQEKRPFFIEGKNILNFVITGGDGPFSGDNLFYSRRIGRNPHHHPDTEDDEYIDMPENTTIIGAFKLTGKTKKGLSIGVLEGVTAEEKAEIEYLGQRRHETVEPLTNYFVGRLQKDYDKGKTIIGGMFTATNRSITDPDLNFLHRSAYTGGLDFDYSWSDRTYYFSVKTTFSHVRGDSEAILETQQSPLRYFQRPDADYVSVDSTRTSLGGTIRIGKGSSGHIRFDTGVTWRSPGLELNDVGYLRSADLIMEWIWFGYRIWEPFSIFRNFNINLNQWRGWDFGYENTFDGGNINLHGQCKNNWGFGTGINIEGESISNSALRGGPSIRWPGGWSNWFNFNSDYRKRISFNFGGFNYWGENNTSKLKNFWCGGTYRPSNALTISLYPSINIRKQKMQYVSTEDYGAEERYIFAKIDQKTVYGSFRLNYSITPNLSIQYYGQPFVSAGKYSHFKRITDPRDSEFENRFHTFTGSEISYDSDEEEYKIDEDLNGEIDYSIGNPDFNFREFRSNLVIQWEYIPGSTLYLVWSQGRTDFVSTGDFSFKNDMRDLFDVYPHNVFLIKLSYWFSW